MTVRLLVPMRGGEIELVCRAMRVYIKREQDAIQEALLAARARNAKPGSKAMLHYEDVKRQATAHQEAAGALIERLLKDPEMKYTDR